MPRPCPFSQEQQEIIASQKYTATQLSNMFGIKVEKLYSYVRSRHIKLPIEYVPGKTVKNHNLFKIWTNDSAYLVGFLLGDGCLHQPTRKHQGYNIEVGLSPKDKAHLEKLRILFGTSSPITDYTNGRSHPVSRLLVHSRTIFNDLIDIGVTPKKTYTAKWIDKCPKEFVPHMLRGLFDADGSIGIGFWANRPQGSLNISFSGTEFVMLGIQKVFSEHYSKNVGSVYHADDGEYYYYNLGGNRVCIAFCNWIYKDSNDSNRLDRKYLTFKNYYDEYVKNPRTHLYMNRGNGYTV